jgi:hypothetical protein
MATLTATITGEIVDIIVEMARGARGLHSKSMRLMTALRCVRPNAVCELPSRGGGASVGIQSRSIESTLVIRQSFLAHTKDENNGEKGILPGAILVGDYE